MRRLLEEGRRPAYGYLQASDLTLTFEGERIRKMVYTGGGQAMEIADDTPCVVVLDAFITNGGDGYDASLFTGYGIEARGVQQLRHRHHRRVLRLFTRPAGARHDGIYPYAGYFGGKPYLRGREEALSHYDMSSYTILIIIAVYFAILLGVAWITGRSDSNEAFFLGERKSPWYIVSIGMIGTSLSGVTFVSVPGMVRSIDMTYMQTVLGFFVGYVLIAHVLLPLYYKLRLTSIYAYLDTRIGRRGYKTGASFFLLSKIVGAAARLYLVVLILQTYVFDAWHVPFVVTAILSIFLVWLYTFRSGVRTIIWTDTLQAICLVAMLVVIIWQVKDRMGLDFVGMARTIGESPRFRIFEFGDWHSTQHFAKQFLSGIFITIVMTGLDQDMMQKNLSCKSLRDAQKNMYTYGFAFTPVNFLFLSLGVLLLTLAERESIPLPALSDDILPMFCTSGILGDSILIFFTVGIIAAAFSSADSALTALTTSFCVDILGIEREEAGKAKRTRLKVHLLISVLFVLIILAFKAVNNRSVIDAIYMIASYTYGPLLGLFVFGLFTRRKPIDRYVPYICVLSPLVCFTLDYLSQRYAGYTFGYEMLMVNGGLTFGGLYLLSERKS